MGEQGDDHYMVMELIDGRDVGQLVKRCRAKKVAWPIDFAVYLTEGRARGAGLRARSGRHAGPATEHHSLRRLALELLRLDRAILLKLGDFGVARSLLEGGASEVMGKPYYLSPEALEGHLSSAVDLWAVAAVTCTSCLPCSDLSRARRPRLSSPRFAARSTCRCESCVQRLRRCSKG